MTFDAHLFFVLMVCLFAFVGLLAMIIFINQLADELRERRRQRALARSIGRRPVPFSKAPPVRRGVPGDIQ